MKIPVSISLYNETPRGVFDDPGENMTTVFAEIADVGKRDQCGDCL